MDLRNLSAQPRPPASAQDTIRAETSACYSPILQVRKLRQTLDLGGAM